MTIREAIKQQRKSIKNRSPKEQFSYFGEYYGIKTICLILAAVAVIAFLVTLITKKDPGFSGVFFGAEPQPSAESYLAGFAGAAGIDLEKQEVSVQASPDIQMDQQITQDIYQSMEAFTAMVAAKTVDCFAGNTDLFLYYAYLGYAADLRTVLTPEELEQLSPYLHYIDGKLIEEQENADDGLATAFSRRSDSARPELMADPIPVAVSLSAATDAFQESYRFPEGAVIGICAGSELPENALAFFRYCLGLPLAG